MHAAPAPVERTGTPTLKLGQIAERLGFTLTADFLKGLGFEPAATDRASKLYFEADFPLILAAGNAHLCAHAIGSPGAHRLSAVAGHCDVHRREQKSHLIGWLCEKRRAGRGFVHAGGGQAAALDCTASM